MLDGLQRCFPREYEAWKPTLQQMVPSLGQKLSDNVDLFQQVWDWSTRSLQLGDTPAAAPAHAAPVVESASV